MRERVQGPKPKVQGRFIGDVPARHRSFDLSSRISHLASRISGFSFIEVLIALVVASILIATVCVTLITALRAERRADSAFEAQQRAMDIASWSFAGMSATNAPAAWPDRWLAAAETTSVGEGTNRVAWTVWEVSDREDPGHVTRLALRR